MDDLPPDGGGHPRRGDPDRGPPGGPVRDGIAVANERVYGPSIRAQLEDYGFVGVGEGGYLGWGGDRIRVGGELPLNTSGSLMSEAYIHGMNLIAEAVRQIRGTSPNQVKDVELSMTTAGLGVPTGALILRK